MNKKIIIVGVIVVLVIIGALSLLNNSSTTTNNTPAVTGQTQVASSTVSLMQSTRTLFSQDKYFTKAHEIFPTLAADTTKTLGAFSYTKESLGNNVYKITLTNNVEGYKGQSVTVGAGQSVYFIEASSGDDSATEDSGTRDDTLVAVDAQGYELK